MSVRTAKHAGTFYPASADAVSTAIAHYRYRARTAFGGSPVAIVAPHAGWRYCGRVIASALNGLEPQSKKRVLHLAPSHHQSIDNVRQSEADSFATALGVCQLTTVSHKLVSVDSALHEPEHALEVQLPFLQAILGTFEYVPLIVGHCSAQALQNLLRDLGADSADTLTVVSSDLSHYLPRDQAMKADRATLQMIESLDSTLDTTQACGAHALNGVLAFAADCGWRVAAVDRCDTATFGCAPSQTVDSVVGYGAVMFHARPQ